jgi:phytoene dehydrogenase-like protein
MSLLFNPIGHPAPFVRGVPLLGQPRRLLEFAQLMGGSSAAMVERVFRGEDARLWLTGSVLHSDLSPDDAGGAAFGLMLCALSQSVGMPIPRGGAQAIADALTSLLAAHGGRVLGGQRVEQIVVRDGRAVAVRTPTGEITARRAILATVQPQGLFLDLVGAGHLPDDFVKLVRRFRWGTGTFTLHCALSDLPTFNADALNGTLAFHLGRSTGELRENVTAARNGVLPPYPLLIAGIHTLIDPSRAPAGRHTLWAMTHVPARIVDDAGGTIDARTWREAKAPFLERLLDELEVYAPGFRSLVLAAEGHTPEELQAHNANLLGGDIGAGSYTLDQQLVFRPVPGWFRYKTPVRSLYMSGASNHPGGGVHGAAGANAARVLLGDLRLAPLVTRVWPGTSIWPGAARRNGRSGHALTGHAERPDGPVRRPIATTAEGTGPLRQQDYWATLEGTGLTPERVMELIRTRFAELASTRLVRFSRPRGQAGPLRSGDQLKISMPGSRPAYVQVVHDAPAELTLRTLRDHPEIGRLSFRVEWGPVVGTVVRVRSRTRANSALDLVKYELAGKPLQARLWTGFLGRVAKACGGHMIGEIGHTGGVVESTADDERPTATPAFAQRGDA